MNTNPKKDLLSTEMSNYFNCPCQLFQPMLDDDPLMEMFYKASVEGKQQGFTPMLVTSEDDLLWENLFMNSDPENKRISARFHPGRVAAYRKRILSSPLPDGKQLLDYLLKIRKEETEQHGLDWDAKIKGPMIGGDAISVFYGYWDFNTKMTVPVTLAKIPVKNPWEVFAWIPFGGWNDCPSPLKMIAIAKYWYHEYGAVPAVITHDVLEFSLSTPVPREKALQLALEQYAFCPDIIDQCPVEEGNIGSLADSLSKSTTWYFWWN